MPSIELTSFGASGGGGSPPCPTGYSRSGTQVKLVVWIPVGSSPMDSSPTFPPISTESRWSVIANIGCLRTFWLIMRVNGGPNAAMDDRTSEPFAVMFCLFTCPREGRRRKSKLGNGTARERNTGATARLPWSCPFVCALSSCRHRILEWRDV